MSESILATEATIRLAIFWVFWQRWRFGKWQPPGVGGRFLG